MHSKTLPQKQNNFLCQLWINSVNKNILWALSSCSWAFCPILLSLSKLFTKNINFLKTSGNSFRYSNFVDTILKEGKRLGNLFKGTRQWSVKTSPGKQNFMVLEMNSNHWTLLQTETKLELLLWLRQN
jgi:hypothetical protein